MDVIFEISTPELYEIDTAFVEIGSWELKI